MSSKRRWDLFLQGSNDDRNGRFGKDTPQYRQWYMLPNKHDFRSPVSKALLVKTFHVEHVHVLATPDSRYLFHHERREREEDDEIMTHSVSSSNLEHANIIASHS